MLSAPARGRRRNNVPHLSLHLATPLALAAVLGVVAPRLIVKTVKVGLLLAAPALIYLLHMH